jgi:CrcB protein
VTWRALVAVAAGGALGTLGRVGIDVALEPSDDISTALVNLSGALLLGFAIGHGLGGHPSWFREGITVGFLGSFTTMSGVALLAVLGTWWWGFWYVGTTLILGIAAVWVGHRLGRMLRKAGS